MGRKRTKDFGLPANMYRRGPSYFFADRNGKWHNLGQDYPDALLKYARFAAYRARRNTVSALLDQYFLEYIPANPIESSTLQSYRISADHIRSEWGDDLLEQVSRGDCQRYLDTHPKRGAALNAMRFFKLVMDRAVAWELLTVNPLDHVKFPKREPRKRVLSDDEYNKIRAALLPKLRVIVDMAYLLSARVSEVSAIRWDDIRDDVLYMRRKKTKDVQPFIVTPELQALFDEARSLGGKIQSMQYLLINERRKPFNERYVSQAFSAAAERVGIKDVRFHDVRRTAANVDRKTAQERLGHADQRTTRGYLVGRDAVLPLKDFGKSRKKGGASS